MSSDDCPSADVGASCREAFAADADDEQPINYALLHPSVRFYRGMWKLTLARDSSSTAPSEQPGLVTEQLSVVALHQRLLPPAPVDGLGEIADESYAAQLATTDGIDFLREHWDLLLPLLFPCSSCSGSEAAAGSGGAANAAVASSSSTAAENKAQQEGHDESVDGDEGEAPETTWCEGAIWQAVQRPLSEEDLKVVREPGLMDRVYYSYIVLLRFFGWRVHDEQRGLLDRTRAWAQRYAQLEECRSGLTHGCDEGREMATASGGGVAHMTTLPPPPMYTTFDFYRDGLPRVLRGLLDIGFLRLAVRLVEFLMEEMSSGRLLFLQGLLQHTLLPMVDQHEHVEPSHKRMLEKRFYRLTHSDSD